MKRRTWGLAIIVASACTDGASGDAGSEGDSSTAADTTTAEATIDPTVAPTTDGDATAAETTAVADSSDTGPADTGSESSSTGEPVDATFSFMVIPDTQNEVLSDSGAAMYFDHRIDWIVENRDALDVRWVLQTGDLVNWDTPDHDQYVRASVGFEAFDDAALPYVIAIGNHDTAATCKGGSACPGDTNMHLRDTSTFNEYFPTTRFPTLTDVFEAGKCDNSYHLIEAGGLDWVIINIELWARTEAYQWMGQVLADHPGHNAIVITHSHLDDDSGIFASNGGYGDNSPQTIFDEVLSQHANVRLVFSGHTGISGFREDVGVNGNTIHQFLYNRIDGVNPVRVVEIDTDARTLDSYVYSPVTDENMETFGCTVNLTDLAWVE
jgi:hypothetical protein